MANIRMRVLPAAALASQSCSCGHPEAQRDEAPLPQVLHTVLQALSWPPQALQKSQERAGGQAASEHLQDELGPHNSTWLPSKYPVSGDLGGGGGCFYLMCNSKKCLESQL
ncbi:unnamed protein product [Pipistrellus nathusii]|uniref:Uncharacterized protein n=1 Tax=Pipistrellus nathusii TaxID=59473 RepID=A0ABP0ALG6_PIPNA